MVKELGDVIINARNVLSRRVRNRDRVLTTAMWVLYAYLWLPLISLGAWYLGVQFAYDLVLRAGGPESLLTLLFWFGITLLCTALVIIFWSWMQRARFANSERRLNSPELTPEEERSYWGLEPDVLERIKTSQRLFVNLDSDGQIQNLDS